MRSLAEGGEAGRILTGALTVLRVGLGVFVTTRARAVVVVAFGTARELGGPSAIQKARPAATTSTAVTTSRGVRIVSDPCALRTTPQLGGSRGYGAHMTAWRTFSRVNGLSVMLDEALNIMRGSCRRIKNRRHSPIFAEGAERTSSDTPIPVAPFC